MRGEAGKTKERTTYIVLLHVVRQLSRFQQVANIFQALSQLRVLSLQPSYLLLVRLLGFAGEKSLVSQVKSLAYC